jgi:hypothetical protein
VVAASEELELSQHLAIGLGTPLARSLKTFATDRTTFDTVFRDHLRTLVLMNPKLSDC